MKFAIGPLVRDVSQWAGRSAIGPQVALAAACLAAVAAFALLQPTLHADAVLPTMTFLFYLMACIAVLLAWLDGGSSNSSRLTYWDVSGLLTLIGICIAAAVEPEAMGRLVAAGNRAD
jgi:hypothetical protein